MNKIALLSLTLLVALVGACDGEPGAGSGQDHDQNNRDDAAIDMGADRSRDRGGDRPADAGDATVDVLSDTASDTDASGTDAPTDADPEEISDATDTSDLFDGSDSADQTDVADRADASDSVDTSDLGDAPDIGPPEPCDIPEFAFAFDPSTDCRNTYRGAVIITSNDDEDWSLLSGVDCIEGGIVIERTTLATISLPDLAYVSQNVILWQNGATSRIDLPELRRIGGELQLASSPVTEVSAPVLEEIGDKFNVERMNALEELSLPALLRVGGNIELGDTYSDRLESLTHVSFPQLVVVVGDRFLVGSELPVSLEAPSLVQSGRLDGYGGLELSSPIGDAFTCARGCSTSFEDCLSLCGGPVTVDLSSLCTANGIKIYYPQHVDLTVDLGSLRNTDSLSVGTLQDGRIRSIDVGQLQRSETVGLGSTGFSAIELPALVDSDVLELGVISPRFPFAEGCDAECRGALTAPLLSSLRTINVVCAECDVDLSGLRHVTSTLHVTGNPHLDLSEIEAIDWAWLTSSGQRTVSAVVSAAMNTLEIESAIESPIRLDGVVELELLTLSRISGAEPQLMDTLVAPDLVSADRIYLDNSDVINLAAPALTSLTAFENNGDERFATVDFGDLEHIDDFDWRNSYGGVNVPFTSITTLGELSVGTSDCVPQFPNLTHAETLYAGLDRVVLVVPATSVGTLSLTSRSGVWFSAPALETLDHLDLHGPEPAGPIDLSDVLPSLDEITGSFQMDSAWYATSLVVPNLRIIGGSSYVRFNTRLQTVSFPDLESAGGITIKDNRDLEAVSLPSLAAVRWFTISENPNLPQCDLIAQARELFTPPPESGRYCVETNGDDCADDCP